MKTPLVEIDGDEMTRIIWAMIKEKLILPFVDLKTEYYDLSLLSRNATEDRVTVDAAQAALRLGVAVKCATITPNKKRMEEYPQLTKLWPSPNGTIRSIMGGTIFRTPIVIDGIKPVVTSGHPRRDSVPRTDPGQRGASHRQNLEKTDYDRTPCLRRFIQGCGTNHRLSGRVCSSVPE